MLTVTALEMFVILLPVAEVEVAVLTNQFVNKLVPNNLISYL